MSKVISLRLEDDQIERLDRLARRLNRQPTSLAHLLLEEKLREAEFSAIEVRQTAAGRAAFVRGTGLAVWEIMAVLRAFAGDVAQTAEHLSLPSDQIEAARNYHMAYPDEVDAALAENDSYDFAKLKRRLPGLELIEVEP